MPEGSKCSDYEYEQYGFENKQFSLEHSMVSRLPHNDHDLSVIDEIPYLDEGPQPQFAYVTEQTPECDEVLTIYKICSSDDLLTVQEEPVEEETEEAHETQLLTASTSENTDAILTSSVECAVHAYIKNAPSDISVNIESSGEVKTMKTDICTVIQRGDSMELLSGSRSSSTGTVTGYDFDTVKNLNLDSCSTSKLSLSLKSDGFDDFTLTPDEQKKVVRNCDVEDFTLTPEASCNDVVPFFSSTFDDVPFIETWQSDRVCGTQREQSADLLLASEASAKPDDESISSNEVVMVVDKFLSNERLLQQSLNIIPVDAKSFTSPLISPIDSDASSTNALIEKQKSILFNLQSSSSKSTLDDAIDIDKMNFDEDVNGANETRTALTDEMTKEFDILFSRAAIASSTSPNTIGLSAKQCETASSIIDNQQNSAIELDALSIQRLIATPTPTRIPTRYSMQKLEPLEPCFFSDDTTQCSNRNELTKDIKNDADSFMATAATAAEATSPTTTSSDSKKDCCRVLDAHNGSFIQKRILSKLKKNKSQSLGNLNKKSRCFPL